MIREHRELPIELVDPPPAPTRFEEELLDVESLAVSIREKGQLQPGGVVEEDGRFIIVYGHRRYLACLRAELELYSAYVYTSTTEAMLGAQLDENVERKQLNPVEEAYWFAQLLDALGGDTDVLATNLKRSRDYVEARLNLLRGDPAVLAAMRRGVITLGVAKRLNAYANAGDRAVLLDAAVAGGASERLVTQWIAERKAVELARGGLPALDPAILAATPDAEPPEAIRCLLCDSDEEIYNMVHVWLHKPCRRILDAILARHTGGLHVEEIEARADVRR